MVVASSATVNANVPIRKNTVDPMEFAYASLNEQTPVIGIITRTSSAVAANGSASVTQSNTPAARIDKTIRPSYVNPAVSGKRAADAIRSAAIVTTIALRLLGEADLMSSDMYPPLWIAITVVWGTQRDIPLAP